MEIKHNSIIPVILSGGSGTRLWPLSRESYPKQFLALDSRKKQSLLQSTYERLLGLEGLEKPILICNEDHRFIVAEQFREINIDPQAIVLEPVGRNTAPAIAVAALQSISLGKEVARGEKNKHAKKSTPITSDVIPVLPPAFTPAPDST